MITLEDISVIILILLAVGLGTIRDRMRGMKKTSTEIKKTTTQAKKKNPSFTRTRIEHQPLPKQHQVIPTFAEEDITSTASSDEAVDKHAAVSIANQGQYLNPMTLRQAIIWSEIIQRPKFRRQNWRNYR